MAMPADALDKHDLEATIRSLDVTSVKQIIENEKLTVREYNRYLNLADEIVFSRELWTREWDICRDVTTPYTPSKIPSKIPLECAAAMGMILLGCGTMVAKSDSENWGFFGGAGMTLSGFWLLFKWASDSMDWTVKEAENQRKLLQKKYEDALTIQQLIYAADIVEA